ncbi:MAG: methionine adenosyltransferase [Chlorobiaceae bacterium]|nr:methionine adenosyltransferase [Chlorobiaceae bacterium]NTV61702.1 methionine adenosyltransferase [Chlorobiaceae bacterium]
MSMSRNIIIEDAGTESAAMRQVELVERKGKGHPDTICDSVMEAVSISLCREYTERAGSILHHNIDKGLLVAGRSSVRPGGGKVLEPMKIIFGDRAADHFMGTPIPVGEIAEAAAITWLKENLRFVDPERDVRFQNEIRPGSAELTDIFSRKVMGANDTSAGTGYAPLSETETMVLETERFLNSPEFKQAFPETGEDVKIMGYRNRNSLTLTVAMAFVDRFVSSASDYFERKQHALDAIRTFIEARSHTFSSVEIAINTLDDPARGENGIYLTVLGTSADGADSGEVGRGNRVNGLISFGRPTSLEAAAGKNPVSHVGKIYNLLARETAARIHREVRGVAEVSVFLCSQIGKPLDRPLAASARVTAEPGVQLKNISDDIASIIDQELAGITAFTRRLARGEFAVC